MPKPQKYKLTARQKRMFSDYEQRQYASAQPTEPSVNAIDSIESIYKALNDRDEIKAKALLMLMLRNWLTEVSSFDPVSGHALHTGIVGFFNAVTKSIQTEVSDGETKDRIYRIVSHTKGAVLAIMKHIRDKILREHVMLPIYAVREVDSKSVQWLSRQSGRTLREKLSGKPYMKAVRRRTSIDTAENRLLKAFLFRLEQILIERQNALSTTKEDFCEELLAFLQRWLRTEDAAEIGAWGNLPPNNTLLQDKRYRKVWDGWLSLQTIDEQITGDSKRVHRDILSVIYWNTLSLLNHSGRFRTVQQPIALDYDNFSIVPELPVGGYLFSDNSHTKISGAIDSLVSDRGFGFIDGCFFHASDLMDGLRFDELQIGDQLLFDVEETPKGKCAKRLEKGFQKPPRQITFELLNEQINISVDEETISILVDRDQIVFGQKNQGGKNKLKIESATLKDIPKTILSLITDTSFEYSDPTNNQSDPIRVDSSVVNLCSIRPAFTNNTGSQAYLPFRLLQQIWSLKDGSKHVIDCGKAKAITLSDSIETVSMLSLFSHSLALPDATKSSASMFFARKLSDYIKTDKLTYLVPDWGNDFDLEVIRKSVNFYFNESTPLPKSIAAIFAWQSSERFIKDRVRENDFVLVVDSFDGGISITPVQAVYQKELDTILPETQGIIWERHPTVVVPDSGIHTAMVRSLKDDGCQASEELLHLFGFDGLVNHSGEVSFVKDEQWYHLPGSIREVLTQDLDLSILSSNVIRDCLSDTNRDCRKKACIFILPLDETIRNSDGLMDGTWLGATWSPIKGGQTLNRWQEEVEDIVLWRDHLPELYFTDIPQQITEKLFWWADFNLVKDVSVIPKRGRVKDIWIERTFTLPVNPKEPQDHYCFGLRLGKGNKELRYQAYLKSSAFPLKKDTECKLKMTYTYGADDPYELKFIPLNSEEAGFKFIRVRWRPVSEGGGGDLKNLPVPDFPARKSWSDFQKFPKEDGNFPDLLDWCCRKIAGLNDLISFDYEQEFQAILNKRKVGYLKWGTTDRTGKYYCRVDVDGESVFCHSSQFIEAVDENALYEGGPVYLDVFTNEKGPSGSNISFSESLPSRLQEKAHDTINRKLSSIMASAEKGIFSLRFPVLTIWNHGHSLSESDVPDHFRNEIFKGTKNILSIINSENISDNFKKELFFFLCCLQKDAPEYVVKRLIEMSCDDRLLIEYNRNIAFAIGDAELLWQGELLKNVINKVNDKYIALEILAIALWRSEKLILKLVQKDFDKCNRNLLQKLEQDLIRLSSDISQNRIDRLVEKGLSKNDAAAREREYQLATICKHLELLLALLRSRGFDGEEFKMIFAPNNGLTQKYITLVDDISKIVIDGNFELISRISIEIEKPETFRNTPDLLYALRIYLTGDSGANTIVITGVNDES